jgi:hypothetical protein
MNSSPTHVSFRLAPTQETVTVDQRDAPARETTSLVQTLSPKQKIYRDLAIWAILRDNDQEGGLDVVEAMVCT